MTKFEEIKLMNESTIIYLKKMGGDSTKNEIIKKILEDDACFFKIDKKDSLVILQDIGIKKEKIKDLYKELISKEEFYLLYQKGKINKDTDLKIKYEINNNDSFFINKNNKKE